MQTQRYFDIRSPRSGGAELPVYKNADSVIVEVKPWVRRCLNVSDSVWVNNHIYEYASGRRYTRWGIIGREVSAVRRGSTVVRLFTSSFQSPTYSRSYNPLYPSSRRGWLWSGVYDAKCQGRIPAPPYRHLEDPEVFSNERSLWLGTRKFPAPNTWMTWGKGPLR